MAKDPRFNFYPDNYLGGTMGFTLEQHGAYVQLMLLQFYVGPFTEFQALDHLVQLARGNTTVATGLWQFLIPKFKTDGATFWSERLMKEMKKSERHSQLQADRVKKRWDKEKNQNGNTAVLPVNGTGIGIESGTDFKNIKESLEKFDDVPRATNEPLPGALVWSDEIYRENLFRLARSHGVTDLENLLDRWEGWYVNKFEWRKKELQEIRLSFESWIKDPKSRMNFKINGNSQHTSSKNRDRFPTTF